ncbi:MAG: DinB family protein [Bryobacteraceae bacterium]
MSAIQALIQELEQEAATTRRVLERVPDAHLAWRPHAKSMSMGQLSLHIASTPGNVAEMSRRSPFEMPDFTQPAAATNAELLRTHDESVARAREILSGMSDSDLGQPWRVVAGGKEVMTMPVGAVLRTIMLNHWYHHRGQLSVYLREVGVPLPSIYGPSADENPFAAREAVATA